MSQRPVVLSLDPGEHNVGVGVLGDRIMESRLLILKDLPWDLACACFREEIDRCLALTTVDVLAIEGWHWPGVYATNEPPIRELIGIARSYSRAVDILVIPHQEWSQAITGQRPPRRDFLEGSKSWKRIIRSSLKLHFMAMGIDLDAVVGKDVGNHKTDALALGLYAQNLTHLGTHLHAECH